jgi:poly-gamma-glutamate capsule biosynthesis protein CapA/YwtB (metallophosphatase superfamily)
VTIRIALAGDTMLGRGVAAEIAAAGARSLFSREVRDWFASADLALLNLECCVSDRGSPWGGPAKPFHFRAPPQAAAILTDLGIGCVTLANNHALDYGYAALADTIDYLTRSGIKVAGAGADLRQARAPVLLQARGTRVAVLGVTDHPADFAAGPANPGAAYANLAAGIPRWLTSSIRCLAADGDLVLVMPHWGPNMTTRPRPYIRAAAQGLVAAGAALVAGHSAHVFHGVAGRVLFDMGDFIDDYATDPLLRNDLGLLFMVTLDGQHLERVEALPLKLRYAHTGRASGADRAWITARYTRACAAMGTEVHDEGGRLVTAGT